MGTTLKRCRRLPLPDSCFVVYFISYVRAPLPAWWWHKLIFPATLSQLQHLPCHSGRSIANRFMILVSVGASPSLPKRSCSSHSVLHYTHPFSVRSSAVDRRWSSASCLFSPTNHLELPYSAARKPGPEARISVVFLLTPVYRPKPILASLCTDRAK